MLKYSVAGVALRDISRNNLSRHSAMPWSAEAASDSRLAKNVVLIGSNGSSGVAQRFSAAGTFGSSMYPKRSDMREKP